MGVGRCAQRVTLLVYVRIPDPFYVSVESKSASEITGHRYLCLLKIIHVLSFFLDECFSYNSVSDSSTIKTLTHRAKESALVFSGSYMTAGRG